MSHLTDSFNHVNENHLPSSIAFFTARRPSRRASLICVKVCLFGPLRSSVTDRGLLHSSTKVNFSSPCIKKVKFYATQDPNPNTIFPFSFSSKEAKFNTPPEICLTIYHSLYNNAMSFGPGTKFESAMPFSIQGLYFILSMAGTQP